MEEQVQNGENIKSSSTNYNQKIKKERITMVYAYDQHPAIQGQYKMNIKDVPLNLES